MHKNKRKCCRTNLIMPVYPPRKLYCLPFKSQDSVNTYCFLWLLKAYKFYSGLKVIRCEVQRLQQLTALWCRRLIACAAGAERQHECWGVVIWRRRWETERGISWKFSLSALPDIGPRELSCEIQWQLVAVIVYLLKSGNCSLLIRLPWD